MLHHGPRGRVGRWAFLWVAVVVGAVSIQDALAQVPEPQPQEPPTFELPEVIVPGKRPQPSSTTPASVSVISREDIERSGARTVADVLRALPETSVRAYGGLGSLALPSIRGSSPSQVLVLLDGVPLNNVALGQTDLSTISVDAVERIEVLRGPFASIYGSGALGGVINIVTAGIVPGRIAVRAGGFDLRSATVSAGQVAVTADATGGDRPNSDYAGTTIAGNIALSPVGRFLLHYYRADLGTPGDVAFPTPSDRQAETRAVAQATFGSGDLRSLAGRMYYVADDLTFAASFGTSTYTSAVLGGELQRVWEFAPGHQMTAGLEFQRQTLNASISGTPLVEEESIGAGYVQYDAAVSDRTLLSMGLRVDAHSIYGATVNPRAGVVVRLNDQTRLRAAVGRTFRGPTFLELFFPLFGCSNPGLEPETAWAGEIGLERQAGQALYTATLFETEATNLITGGCPPQNIGTASIWGLSVEAKRTLGPVRVTANLTAIRAIDVATGSPLRRVPAFTANLILSHQVGDGPGLTLLASYVGPRTDFDAASSATIPMPGYVDLRLRYQLSGPAGWMVIVGVDNVLDQVYEPVRGYPAPGRNVFISAATQF